MSNLTKINEDKNGSKKEESKEKETKTHSQILTSNKKLKSVQSKKYIQTSLDNKMIKSTKKAEVEIDSKQRTNEGGQEMINENKDSKNGTSSEVKKDGKEENNKVQNMNDKEENKSRTNNEEREQSRVNRFENDKKIGQYDVNKGPNDKDNLRLRIGRSRSKQKQLIRNELMTRKTLFKTTKIGEQFVCFNPIFKWAINARLWVDFAVDEIHDNIEFTVDIRLGNSIFCAVVNGLLVSNESWTKTVSKINLAINDFMSNFDFKKDGKNKAIIEDLLKSVEENAKSKSSKYDSSLLNKNNVKVCPAMERIWKDQVNVIKQAFQNSNDFAQVLDKLKQNGALLGKAFCEDSDEYFEIMETMINSKNMTFTKNIVDVRQNVKEEDVKEWEKKKMITSKKLQIDFASANNSLGVIDKLKEDLNLLEKQQEENKVDNTEDEKVKMNKQVITETICTDMNKQEDKNECKYVYESDEDDYKYTFYFFKSDDEDDGKLILYRFNEETIKELKGKELWDVSMFCHPDLRKKVLSTELLNEVFAVWNLERVYFFYTSAKVLKELQYQDEKENEFFNWYQNNIVKQAFYGLIDDPMLVKKWMEDEVWKEKVVMDEIIGKYYSRWRGKFKEKAQKFVDEQQNMQIVQEEEPDRDKMQLYSKEQFTIKTRGKIEKKERRIYTDRNNNARMMVEEQFVEKRNNNSNWTNKSKEKREDNSKDRSKSKESVRKNQEEDRKDVKQNRKNTGNKGEEKVKKIFSPSMFNLSENFFDKKNNYLMCDKYCDVFNMLDDLTDNILSTQLRNKFVEEIVYVMNKLSLELKDGSEESQKIKSVVSTMVNFVLRMAKKNLDLERRITVLENIIKKNDKKLEKWFNRKEEKIDDLIEKKINKLRREVKEMNSSGKREGYGRFKENKKDKGFRKNSYGKIGNQKNNNKYKKDNNFKKDNKQQKDKVRSQDNERKDKKQKGRSDQRNNKDNYKKENYEKIKKSKDYMPEEVWNKLSFGQKIIKRFRFSDFHQNVTVDEWDKFSKQEKLEFLKLKKEFRERREKELEKLKEEDEKKYERYKDNFNFYRFRDINKAKCGVNIRVGGKKGEYNRKNFQN